VRAACGCLVDFWGMWCCTATEAGCIGYVVVMVVGESDVVIWRGWWGNIVVWRRWRGWVSVEVLLPLIRWWVLSLLLLAEDANGILQFC
jgi:hypothetical protein